MCDHACVCFNHILYLFGSEESETRSYSSQSETPSIQTLTRNVITMTTLNLKTGEGIFPPLLSLRIKPSIPESLSRRSLPSLHLQLFPRKRAIRLRHRSL